MAWKVESLGEGKAQGKEGGGKGRLQAWKKSKDGVVKLPHR